ncbi:MAG: hypothetical protein QJR05_05880 [Thermoanaerobacterium sp.]|nr:hypothetical protein [Thermoanaerobacterium sp.]
MTFDKNYGYDLPERQIMINSTFVYSEFPELVKVLEEYESLNEHIAIGFDKKLREILARESLVKIYERAKEEWSAVKDGFNLKIELHNWRDNIHCQLCGQHITKKYFIKNKVNDREL